MKHEIDQPSLVNSGVLGTVGENTARSSDGCWTGHSTKSFRQSALADAALDGHRTFTIFGEVETILDPVEGELTGGHPVNLTHHRVKRRAVHPLIRDVHPDAYVRINLKRWWAAPSVHE